AAAVVHGLVRGAEVEVVRSGGRGRLAYVQEALHVLEAGTYLVLALNPGYACDQIAVLAGVLEGVIVCCSADSAAVQIIKDREGQGLVGLLRGERIGE